MMTLRELCAQLDQYANCSSRIDYQCTVCEAANELELLYERRRVHCAKRVWNDEIIND